METVDVSDAKARLCQLVDLAAAGEDVVLGRNGEPLARITRFSESPRRVKFGVLSGKVRLTSDFDVPLPADVLIAFNGR